MKIKFGTDGFRGVIGKDLTFKTAMNVGMMALRHFMKKSGNRMAVGYDTRFLSPELAAEMAELAARSGYESILSDTFCPSPALSLFAHDNKLSFGLMITASHNPALFNGVKVKERYGGSALPETMAKIALLNEMPALPEKAGGKIKKADLKSCYLERLKTYVPFEKIRSRPINVFINPMHGATIGYMSELFRGSAVTITEVNNVINPSFGGVSPEPIEENLEKFREIVKKKKPAAGFSFDGDGDRISCFDGKGSFYSSQRLLPLFLHYLATVKKEKGIAVKTVSTSSMLAKVAEKNGLAVAEVPIGFKNIVPYFLKGAAVLGGEESGGIAVRGYIPERDGIFCALFLLEILGHYKKNLHDIWAEMEDRYGKYVFRREDYSFEDENRVRKILGTIDFSEICGEKVAVKNFIDGRKFILAGGGFVLIRVSGTEPVVRVYIEAGDNGRLDELFAWTRRKLRANGVNVGKER